MLSGLWMSFQFPGQRAGDLMSNPGTDGRDQLILVFGKWPLLKPEGLQFLPANLIQAESRPITRKPNYQFNLSANWNCRGS